ncbi:MAG: transposase [Bifidobacteriaceae bacterium]|nr:transposase [Bifidobacteriaceae bacterium]
MGRWLARLRDDFGKLVARADLLVAALDMVLALAVSDAHALVDAELYLPKSWAGDPACGAEAGVGEDVGFATKSALAAKMIARALDASVRSGWVAGGGVKAQAQILAARLARRAWNEMSAGLGSKGARVYRWAWIEIAPPAADGAGFHYLLVRRHPKTRELAF